MRELFIYYQVARSDTATLQAQVQAMQQRLCAAHRGLNARLLQRTDDHHAKFHANGSAGSAERCTWMETYASPAGVGAGLQAAIAAAAADLPPGLMGERHTEAFVPCA
ncbi:MAG: DUF4936 family protein [Pseudomonadota bacterium]